MTRILLALGLSLACALPSASLAKPPQNASLAPTQQSAATIEIWQDLVSNARKGPTVYLAACCKICRKGKACGDSCISRSYQCHKGPGCACDGS